MTADNDNIIKVSIVTPTYNSGATLCDTLRSILNQDYANYEVLIIDGGSSDNTQSIVEEFLPKFKGRLKWYSGKDKGLYDAMNKGIAKATGDIIGVLNSDDFYAASNVLSSVVDSLGKVDVVYGDLDFVDAVDTDRVVRRWHSSQYIQGAFLRGWHPAHPTFYARRECFDRYGGFDITFNVSADFELMFRFIEKERVSNSYLPMTFVKMRMGGESTGSIKKIIEGNKNVLRAFKKHGYSIPKFYLFRRLAPKAINLIKHKLQNRK